MAGNQDYQFAYQGFQRDLPAPIEDLNAGGGPRTPGPYATPEEIGNLGNQPMSYLQAAVNPYNTGRFSQDLSGAPRGGGAAGRGAGGNMGVNIFAQ